MKQLKVLSIILVLAGALSSCLKTEDPVPTGLVSGEWVVENVIADGAVDHFSVDAKLYLDNNGTFLFVNVDDRASSGTWTATESTLTLSGNDDYVQEFNIVYVDNNKLHIYRDLSIISGQSVELRYLFKRD